MALERQYTFDAGGTSQQVASLNTPQKPYVFLHVDVLREYLEAELYVPSLPFPHDIERVLDDWVFLCFFVGNDFLPHMPSLEIREGAIDRLTDIYKRSLKEMGGYVTKYGDVNLKRVEVLLRELGMEEDAIFVKRKESEEKREKFFANRNEANKRRRTGEGVPSMYGEGQQFSSQMSFQPEEHALGMRESDKTQSVNVNKDILKQHLQKRNKSAALSLKAALLGVSDNAESVQDDVCETEVDAEGPVGEEVNPADAVDEVLPVEDEQDVVDDEESETVSMVLPHSGQKRKQPELIPAEPSKQPELQQQAPQEEDDEVRLWEEGYKERFYRSKFGLELSDIEERKK
jgi:5'-3' exoribonuclease 2